MLREVLNSEISSQPWVNLYCNNVNTNNDILLTNAVNRLKICSYGGSLESERNQDSNFNMLSKSSCAAGISDNWIRKTSEIADLYLMKGKNGIHVYSGSQTQPKYTYDGVGNFSNCINLPQFVYTAYDGADTHYAITYGGGSVTYTSTDGITWIQNAIPNKPTILYVAPLRYTGNGYIYGTTQTELYTTSGPSSLHIKSTGITRNVNFLAVDTDNAIVVTCGSQGSLISKDGGLTFIESGLTASCEYIVFNSYINQWLCYDTTTTNIYISSNGMTWSSLLNYLPHTMLHVTFISELSSYYFVGLLYGSISMYSVVFPSINNKLIGGVLSIGSNVLYNTASSIDYFAVNRKFLTLNGTNGQINESLPSYNFRSADLITGKRCRILLNGSVSNLTFAGGVSRLVPFTTTVALYNESISTSSFTASIPSGLISFISSISLPISINIYMNVAPGNNQSGQAFSISPSINGSTANLGYFASASLGNSVVASTSYRYVTQLSNGDTIGIVGNASANMTITVNNCIIELWYESN